MCVPTDVLCTRVLACCRIHVCTPPLSTNCSFLSDRASRRPQPALLWQPSVLADPCTSLAADPFLNDVNFVLSVLTLEEGGATGNKGLALLVNNPVHANAIAGLATSATAQATVEVRGTVSIFWLF